MLALVLIVGLVVLAGLGWRAFMGPNAALPGGVRRPPAPPSVAPLQAQAPKSPTPPIPVTLVEFMVRPWTSEDGDASATEHADEGDEAARVDLVAQTCTCRTWRREHAHHPVGRASRLCVHLAGWFLDAGHVWSDDACVARLLAEEDLQDALLLQWVRGESPTIGPVFVGYSFERPWMEVVWWTPKGTLQHAGFNVDEDRWAYGRGPNGANAARAVLVGAWAHREAAWRACSPAQREVVRAYIASR
jgi:hypothetical protein